MLAHQPISRYKLMATSDKITQLDTVKAALLNHEACNSIVMFDANITRLSAIIKRLRNQGYPIVTACDNGNGMANYSLAEGWEPKQGNNKSPS